MNNQVNNNKTGIEYIIGIDYVLVGASNNDDGTYDGFWTVNYDEGYAKLNESDDPDWLENNGCSITRYEYDLESYLEEQGCKNINLSGDVFTFEVEG